MKPVSLSVTASAGGTTYSRVLIVDTYNNPANIGIGIVVTGSALYDVQHTFADPGVLDLNVSTNGTWYNHAFLVSAATNMDGNYAFPPTAIRLALRQAASATATMTIVQAGPTK